MNKARICVVTTSRADYGLLRWLMSEIDRREDMALQLVVTGSHLSVDHGLTYAEIEQDGYSIDARIEMLLSSESAKSVAVGMGVCAIEIADALERLAPDLLVVLGDRYELLPICGAALVMRIPIAHISGGDITEGAIDNNVRNALSMLADLHFPGAPESGRRLVGMGIPSERVHVVGEPGLENIVRSPGITREELARELGLDPVKRWVLLTYHPETTSTPESDLTVLKAILTVVTALDQVQVIATYANADYGGHAINSRLETVAGDQPDRLVLAKSLGQTRYVNLLKNVLFMIGNSSSGIVEAPFVGVWSITVGNRQQGRHLGPGVIKVPGSKEEISSAISGILADQHRTALKDTYYGDGSTSTSIVTELAKFIGTR